MTATRDKFGRPIVVVTGMGVVTSLGAGKADNWTKLTAGESGIRTITRFPIDGLKTTMAGTVDFVPVEPFFLDRSFRKARRYRHRRSRRAVRHRQQGRFSRAAVSRGRAGRGRMAATDRGGTRGRQDRHHHRRHAARQRRRPFHAISPSFPVRLGRRLISPRRSAPRVRRFRCRPLARPAQPRSSSASRPSGAAKPTPRFASPPTARSIRKPWSAFRCCRRCRPRTIRRKPRPSRSRRIATAS